MPFRFESCRMPPLRYIERGRMSFRRRTTSALNPA